MSTIVTVEVHVTGGAMPSDAETSIVLVPLGNNPLSVTLVTLVEPPAATVLV